MITVELTKEELRGINFLLDYEIDELMSLIATEKDINQKRELIEEWQKKKDLLAKLHKVYVEHANDR